MEFAPLPTPGTSIPPERSCLKKSLAAASTCRRRVYLTRLTLELVLNTVGADLG